MTGGELLQSQLAGVGQVGRWAMDTSSEVLPVTIGEFPKVIWKTAPHVIFTSLPLAKISKWVPQKQAFFEHQGMEYIASYLRAAGYEVEVVDPVAESISLDGLQMLIQTHSQNLLGVGVFIRYKDFDVARNLIQWLRSTYPQILVFAGGPILEADEIGQVLREAGAHCMVHGEGEVTSLELIQCWDKGDQNLSKVPGIYCLSDSGQVQHTGARTLIRDLDSLPFPRRDVLKRLLARGEKDVWASFSTLRGCYYPCAFCYINSDYNRASMGKGARFRSVENVLDELSYLYSIGVRNINFVDSTFFLTGRRGQRRAIEIAQGIIERGLQLQLNMLARASDIQEESIAWLRRAGLVRTFIGVESFVQRTLDFLEKVTTVEQNIQAIEILRRHGVKMSYGLIVADPYTTVAELRTTVEHLDKLGLILRAVSHLLLTNVVLVYPNTPLERKLRKDNLLDDGVNFRGGKFRFLHPEVKLFLEMAAHLERVWAYTYEIDLRWARRFSSDAQVQSIKAEAERVFVPWATRLLYSALNILETEEEPVAAERIQKLVREENIVSGYIPKR
jgi:radical SAM superfamily enzyme YgiQ (UPF0313 family)